MREIIKHRINELNNALNRILAAPDVIATFESSVTNIVDKIKQGKKVYLFGNGGSAADAQHIAAELVGRFKKERQALPAEALTVNTSILTALANDYDYSCVFSRQIEAYGMDGDICIGLSTSGMSENVAKAFESARRKNMFIIAITGHSGGRIKELADICICLPSEDTPRIQELTIFIGHIICELVEQSFMGD